jgi:phosphoglycolate phosphatase-like HAD superfamily hydrolase
MDKMIYVFDIDGTICNTSGSDYENSIPFLDRISIVNKLYEEGNTIIFQTARGMGRTKNNQLDSIDIFYSFTKNQLDGWGVKYHDLFLGKPQGDFYVDDKALLIEKIF